MRKKLFKITLSQTLIISCLLSTTGVSAAQSDIPEKIKRTILADIKSDPSYDYGGTSSVDVFDLIRYKSDLLNGYAKYTPVQQFVNDLYQKLLAISPDKAEVEKVGEQLTSGTVSAADVITGIMNRNDYSEKNIPGNEFITIMYEMLLNRSPDESGYQTWTKTVECMSREYVLRGFICSSEFAKRCEDMGIRNGDIVITENRDRNDFLTQSVFNMYRTICGKKLSANELNELTGNILDKKLSLQMEAFKVISTPEFSSISVNNMDYVVSLYRGLLQREPSPDEVSSGIASLEASLSRTSLFRKIAVSDDFYFLYSNKNLGEYIKKIGSNINLNGTWYHISPNGDMFIITGNETLINFLNKTNNVVQQNGSSVSALFNYVRKTTRYRYIEATKPIEQIEAIGWTSFADYAMDNYYCVCYHLAAKMDILLEQAGYQCRIVHATHGSGDHYWNQVYINNTWINYDLTNNWYEYSWERIIQAGDYKFLGFVRPEYR